MTDFGYSLTTDLTSWSSRMTYLPGLIVFLHKMASRWHGLLRRSLSQELSAILTDYCRPSPILLSYLEHVLLSSLPSPLIIISSVLVTCPELSIYFLAHSTRSSYRFSSLPVDNLPYSLLSSFQSNLSSKSIFQLNALFSYIWPILIPSLYRPFLAHFWTFLVPYILECPSWHLSIQYLYIDLVPCAWIHMTWCSLVSWSYYLLFL